MSSPTQNTHQGYQAAWISTLPVETAAALQMLETLDEEDTTSSDKIQHRLTTEQQECYQAFRTSPYEQFKNINTIPAVDTCRWILENSVYLDWVKSDHHSLLWLSAAPGCGKSVLARSLVDTELKASETTICYFFFKDNDEQDSLATALCAILHQLFTMQPNLIQHALPSWQKGNSKIHQDFNELWRIIELAVSDPTFCNTICILDALDECQPTDQTKLIENLKKFCTRNRSSNKQSWLKFLITSRPYDDSIILGFSSIPQDFRFIRIPDEEEDVQIRKEINLVVKSRVSGLANTLHLPSEIQEELETQFLEMKHRTYLWLNLAIDELHARFLHSLRPEQDLTQLIPRSVREAYAKTLNRLPLEARKLLSIITSSRHPLTIEELVMALGVAEPPGSRTIGDAAFNSALLENLRQFCRPFVFFHNSKIYFVHETAREFLVNDKIRGPEPSYVTATQSEGSYSLLASSSYPQEPSNTSLMPDIMANMEKLPEGNSDTESIYTSGILEPPGYVQELASLLFKELECLDAESLERIQTILPDMLCKFAQKIAGEGQKTEYFEVMKFVYKTRKRVTALFGKHCLEAYSATRSSDKSLVDGMSLQEKLSRWQVGAVVGDPNTASQPPPDAEFLDNGYDKEDENDKYNQEQDILPAFGSLVADSTSFQWLCAQLHREASMTSSEAKIMNKISTSIRQKLDTSQKTSPISGKKGPQLYSLQFCSSWKPVVFVHEQDYVGRVEDGIEGAITIIQASNHEVEAVVCSEYLRRTWPLIGESFMELVKHVARSRPDLRCSVTLFDKTRLTAWLNSSGSLYMRLFGTKETVIEAGEMYTWIVTAVRAALGDTITSVFPVLEWSINSPEPTFTVHICAQPSTELLSSEGQCWQNLFGNPVVVQGFPIARSPPSRHPGLELSLGTLGTLLGTQHLVVLCNKIFLKSFCTLLVPTNYEEGIVYWHVLFNADGSRIAFTEPRAREVAGDFNLAKHLTLSGIEIARHVVGWCERVRNYTGSKEANYAISMSGLSSPDSRFAFDRVSISVGKLMNMGVSGVVLKKDRPARVRRASDYHKQLEWIEQRFVVFYDTKDCRGWLVDGLSALLHLVRAALAHKRKVGHEVLFDDDDLKESSMPYRGKATSSSLLQNRANMDLKIYERWNPEVQEATKQGDTVSETILKTQRTWYQFPDLVGDIFTMLSSIFDIQTDTLTEDGFGTRVRMSPRKHLEGWDFMAIATNTDPIWPKVAVLQNAGHGWVDLSRAVNAITLFGAGFGDILQPISANQQTGCENSLSMSMATTMADTALCNKWERLPCGMDLLATTTAIIQDIMEHVHQRTDHDSQFWEVSNGIYWHTLDKTFENCNCTTQGIQCDRVQLLLTTPFPKVFARRLCSPAKPLPEHGAVIFGHRIIPPYPWKSKNNSTQLVGRPVESLSQNSSNQNDSGIGASLTTYKDQSSYTEFPSLPSSNSGLGQATSSQPSNQMSSNSKGKTAATKKVITQFFSRLKGKK